MCECQSGFAWGRVGLSRDRSRVPVTVAVRNLSDRRFEWLLLVFELEIL